MEKCAHLHNNMKSIGFFCWETGNFQYLQEYSNVYASWRGLSLSVDRHTSAPNNKQKHHAFFIVVN